MSRVKGEHLLVNLGAAQLRRRLQGHGFGIRKIESAGRGQAIVIHTATGEHLRQLRSLLADVLPPEPSADSENPNASDPTTE
jgi:hypothetical protein